MNVCRAEWIFASFSGPVSWCLLPTGLETFSLAFALSPAGVPSLAISKLKRRSESCAIQHGKCRPH